MENLFEMVKDFSPYIILGLTAITLILIIVLISISRALGKLETRYRKLMRGTTTKNLEESVVEYLDKIDEAKAMVESCNGRMNEIDDRIKQCVQKISVIRYKAFEDVGSDLSFSIALLNDNNNGVVVTGIFGRNESTTYAKPIDKGISRYDLSEEEHQVLNDAMSK